MSLMNLAGALTIRFQRSGQREDLDDAILCNREVIELQPALLPN